MGSAKSWALSLLIVIGVAGTTKATVVYPVEGLWTVSGNIYRFRVTSHQGPVRGLEIRFSAAAGSEFQTSFESIFDADGVIAGQQDTFLLFPPLSVVVRQEKTPSVLQAAFVGFTTFTSQDVAQIVFNGPPALPSVSGIFPELRPEAVALVELIPGDPESRAEFPITNVGFNPPPQLDPQVFDTVIGVNQSELVGLQLLAQDGSTPANGLIWSDLAVGGPGKDPAFPGASDPSLSADGVFSWNPVGWRSGQYEFHAKVADGGGSDVTGPVLYVNLTVPEPGSLWLLLLGCVLCRCVRRVRE
jgi:hypothetical protein